MPARLAYFLLLAPLLAASSACQHRLASQHPTTECIDPARSNPQGICPMNYDPVCGCNGLTYSNACVAHNAGLRSFRPGPCPGKP
jgi:hypothetical protein